MTERDMMFLVMILIVVSTLTVIVWQFVRSRRRRDDGVRGNWWEGPWDDDRKG